jgi:hypothetical protein
MVFSSIHRVYCLGIFPIGKMVVSDVMICELSAGIKTKKACVLLNCSRISGRLDQCSVVSRYYTDIFFML